MTDETLRCPDCGATNPAGSTSCTACNFPLVEPGRSSPEPAETRTEEPILLRRPMRRPPRGSQQALSLWLMFGFIAAASVVYVGIKANLERASQPVEGSNDNQQKRSDAFRAALDKDSTNVEARIGLANVLYDTANWPEAIVHYRSAIRQDSSRTTAIVDLGVCYYNLSEAATAEELFQLALRHDPHQPMALFNLGIVHERRSDYAGAMSYFHRALESQPPEEMKAAIVEAMQRTQQETGKTAPPLPQPK